MTRSEKAKAYFQKGCNCAQSVALAFADLCDLPEDRLARLASGFGGGMGRLREVCGAFSGAVLVYGLLHGYDDPAARQEKKELYAAIQDMAERFRAENGALTCRELLGGRPDNSPTPEERTAAYYQKRPCADLAASAAGILEQALKDPAL